MSKEFYDKYGKLVDCFSCNCIEPCSKSDSPLCSEGYVFFAKDKIADLEAKLAEKELELQQKNKLIIQEDGECILCGDCYCINNDVRKIIEENTLLKQQLLEKEKEEILWLQKTDELFERGKDYEEIWQFLIDRIKSVNGKRYADGYTHNQDKISFAVEQLEKVKEYIHGKYLDETWHNKIVDEDREDTHDFIDNQIKAIKEMK